MCAGIQELERGTGERNPFFLYYSQTSSPNRSYNEFYEICIVLLTATVSRVLAYA